MRNIVALAVAAALSFGVSAAYATQTDGGFFIGAKGGYNSMDYPTDSGTFGVDTSTGKLSKYMADVHVGYLWPVADVFQLGAQLGYSYYGKYEITETSSSDVATIKTSSINLELVGQWNIQQFFVQARAGAGNVRPSISGTTDQDVTVKSAWDPMAGLSAGYFFTDNFSAEVYVDHVFGKNYSNFSDMDLTGIKPASMNSAGLGVTYSF